MKISIATREDSFLAVTSLFRLANMLIALQHGNDTRLHSHHLSLEDYSFTLDKMRRIEQLCECIDLHISSLSIEELTQTLWSIVTIDASEDYIQKLLVEYHDRIKCHKNQMKLLSFEDIALLIWTVGFVKDRYATNSESLVDEFLDVFVLKANVYGGLPFQHMKRQQQHQQQHKAIRHHFPTFGSFGSSASPSAASLNFPTFDLFPPDFMGKILSPKLVVRMLWSLALHKNAQVNRQNNNINPSQLSFILEGLKTAIQNLPQLTVTNKVSLLWCCSQFQINDKSILLTLLKDLLNYITQSNSHFEGLTLYELKYVTEALSSLSHNIRKLYIKTTAFNLENNQPPEQEHDSPTDYPQHTRPFHPGNHPQFSSPIAMLMAYHNHSPMMNETDIVEVLFEINQIIKELIHQAITNPHGFFENPSMSGILGLFTAATNIEILNYDQEIQVFLNYCLQRFSNEVNTKISATDAASILEAMVTIADYPGLLSENNLVPEANKNNNANSGPKNKKNWSTVAEMIVFSPAWHELAGKLSVIVSLSANEIGDKNKIVASTWAVACLGHSYRPLYRVARRATQFTIHELSASCLARLAVSIAKEEAASFATGGGMSVKLDHEFVDQIAINTLRRATEIESLKELIHAMTCIAFLGRLSSSGTKLQWTSAQHDNLSGASPGNNNNNNKGADGIDRTCELIDVTKVAMKYLSTKQLIRLQWAIGRLPIGIFTSQTSNNLRMELEKRVLFTQNPDAMESKDKVAIQDTFLYVKTLTDSVALKDHKLDYLKDVVCSGLMNHCEILVQKNSSKSLLNYSLGKFSTYEKENFVMKLSILIDSLQTFIELNWFHTDMIELCKNYLSVLSTMNEQEHISNLHTRCAIHFKLGILDELLKVYQNLCYFSMNNKNRKGGLGGNPRSGNKQSQSSQHQHRHSLFSRFFTHNH
jgi:hypothetical protein